MVDLDKCKFRFSDISEIDKQELSRLLEGEDFSFEDPSPPENVHSELMTGTLIVGGIALLEIVAKYYFGRKMRRKEQMKVEVILPNDTTVIFQTNIDETTIEPAEKQFLTQLWDWLTSDDSREK